MSTMRAIVAFQEDFFKHGKGLRPMILNDVADRIGMDISTVSRVVNGKYVQTHFGVFELKYFFSEGLETERDRKSVVEGKREGVGWRRGVYEERSGGVGENEN